MIGKLMFLFNLHFIQLPNFFGTRFLASTNCYGLICYGRELGVKLGLKKLSIRGGEKSREWIYQHLATANKSKSLGEYQNQRTGSGS